MRRMIGVAVAVTLGACGAARAVNVDTYGDVPYVAGAWVWENPDNRRDSNTGTGLHLTAGLPLKSPNWRDWALEASLYEVGHKNRTLGYTEDYQRALLLNVMRDFGTHDWNPYYLPKFKPYVFGGLGVFDDNVGGSSQLNTGIDLGAGLLFPLGYRGVALRMEAFAAGENNGSKRPGEDRDLYADYHFNIGIEIPLTILRKSAPMNPLEVATGCVNEVDPYTGRKTCAADSDRDGVPDEFDHCPGTPKGTAVDASGCPLLSGNGDADGDGVIDSRDACPGTYAGLRVNRSGCALPQIEIVNELAFTSPTSLTLTDGARKGLDAVASMMKGQASMRIEIGVYTDDRTANATELTSKRAELLKRELAKRGVDAARLAAQGYADAKPIDSNATEAGRQANRRVELKISLE